MPNVVYIILSVENSGKFFAIVFGVSLSC